MKPRILAVCLLALLLGAIPPVSATAADGPSDLTISVKDNYGVLPGAVARLFSRDGGASRRAVADRSGIARFASLTPGEYTLRVSLQGFADLEKTDVTIGGEPVEMDLVMTLGRFSTTVTVTTANRREELLMDTAEPTTVIDRAEILDTGARNAKDLLAEQGGSGVQVNVGGGQGYVSLNGVSNKGVLVLINGRRYLGRDANGNFNLEDLPISGMERVEVVKGAGSALYGSDAMGGIINFITAEGKDLGFKNNLNLSGGTYQDYRGDNTLTYRANKGGFAVTGGYRTYDGFDLEPIPSMPNPQTIGQPESKWQNFSASGDYRPSDKVSLSLVGDYSNRDMDKYFFSGATQLASTVYNSQRGLERYTMTPQIHIAPSRDTSINLEVTHGKYNRDETRLYPDRPSNPIVEIPRWTESNDEIKARFFQIWRAAGRENPFQVGFERRKEQLSRSSLVGCASGQSCLKDRDLNVVWAQQELNPTARLRVTAGFRYDDSSDYGNQTSPKVAAVYSLPDSHRLRASYGRGFRAPYFGELFLETFGFQGNPQLKPERSETWTGGWSYTGPKVEGSVDVFRSKIKDGVVFAQLSRFLYTYDNVSKFDSTGTNVNFAFNLPRGFTPSLSYTYTKREDDDGNEIGGFPKHAAFVKLLWSNPRLGLRANVRGNLNGRVPTSLGATSYTPKYSIWYAQASRKITAKGPYAFNVFVQVSNIFDKKNIYNVDLQGNPQVNETLPVWLAPRTYLAGITIDMDWTR